jgi:predicted Zn-dependent peptidase
MRPQIRELVPTGSPAVSDLDLQLQATLSRGALFASVGSVEGQEKAARRELLTLLSSLPKVQFSRNDILSAMVGAITQHYALRQDPRDLLLELALKAFSKTGSRSPREYVSGIRSVTPSHIRSFANRYFPATGQGGS